MGNRGKGQSKGKGGKKGKGNKGRKSGGASKWGDEKAARENDQGQPVKKKRRLVTQEAQDRQRRLRIMDLNRSKDREQNQRLSQPNYEATEAPTSKTKKKKRRKRRRSDAPPAAPSDGREILCYSSSDEDTRRQSNGGQEEEDQEEASGGFDAGLASYKKLLSSLEAGNPSGGSLRRALGSASRSEDKDLAAAVLARRMQREGLDDDHGSSSSGTEEEEEEEEEEEMEKHGDDNGLHESEGRDDVGSEHVEQQGRGNSDKEDEQRKEDDGTELPNGEIPSSTSNGSPRNDFDADSESDMDGDAENKAGETPGKVHNGGRRKDEFCRHFVSTPIFAADKAAELLSARGRPSFKPLSSSEERSMWDAVGLSAAVSCNGKKSDEIVPPALVKGANLSAELGVLPSLTEGWDAFTDTPSASKLQSLLLPPLTGYRDMLYSGWRDEDAEDIRRCYALHVLNHALTSRRRVARHNTRLRKASEETRVAEALARAERKAGGTDDLDAGKGKDVTTANAKDRGRSNGSGENSKLESENGRANPAEMLTASSAGSSATAAHEQSTSSAGGAEPQGAGEKQQATVGLESDDWQRDQGFTRPKVLILLPFRGLAHEVVEIMIGLLGPKTVAINKDRFDEEYGPDEDVEGVEEDGASKGDARAERARAVLERKPKDWKALFGEGRSVDDMFTIGISLSPGGGKGKPGEGKGVAMRLYCDFYNSDIVIASPVALHRAAVPDDGDGGRDGDSGGVDSDFLSSIEVCILDRADVFLMQNWAYVPDIAEVLNSRPTGERAARVDFSRVRPLFLHEQGRLFRQTIVFSAFQDPNLNALVSRHFRNHDGVVKVSRPAGDGYICEVALQAKQVFQRVPCDSLITQDSSRFEYFVGTVLPQVLRARQSHTAVFIPSYFDYVRVRNHLMKNKASVVNVHEYSRGSEVARSRARFFRGDRDLLLYTGRAHFFNRYRIRGIHHLIFYSLPEFPQFYPEMVNLLEEADSVAAVTCLSLFTRYERLSLERIVGEERAGHMLASAKNTFLFC